MANVVVNDASLLDIGNAIREKNGEQTKYKPDAMGTAIRAITTGGGPVPTNEDLVITGNCEKWWEKPINKWIYKNWKEKMSTQYITNAYMMFHRFEEESIPFNIDLFLEDITYASFLFASSSLKQFPEIQLEYNLDNLYAEINFNELFAGCDNLVELPDDYISKLVAQLSNIQIEYRISFSNAFNHCHFLRKLPKLNILYSLESDGMGYNSEIEVNTDYIISYCFSLKEADLPIRENGNIKDVNSASWTPRLRHLTYDKNREYYKEEKLMYTYDVIYDFRQVGYIDPKIFDLGQLYIVLPPEKKIYDGATYFELKNDPEAWVTNPDYSFYNHDSAVETLNSLPTLIVNLDAEGKPRVHCNATFKLGMGSGTEAGGVNELTPQEIAAALAKGYTVSFS